MQLLITKLNHSYYFIRTLILLAILSVLVSVSAKAEAHGRRTALVIGNLNYQNSPLKNTVNDAQDMARVLKKVGFDVIIKINADQKTMDKAVREFGKRLMRGGTGLFYFAGHGIQVEGRNYLLPVDAHIESVSDLRYEAFDAGRVLGKMEDAGNELNVVVLDACRNNPFSRGFRSIKIGLARMDAPKGSFIAYATSPGMVAADGNGRNGLYTKHLLRSLTLPGLTLEQVFKKVRVAVIEETQGKQVPWESTSLTGDFYFVGNSKSSMVTNRLSIPQQEKYSLEGFSNLRSALEENGFGLIPWGTNRTLIQTPLLKNNYLMVKLKLMKEFGEIINALPDGLQSFIPVQKTGIFFENSYVYNLLFDQNDKFAGVVIGLPHAISMGSLSKLSIDAIRQQKIRMILLSDEALAIEKYLNNQNWINRLDNLGFIGVWQCGERAKILNLKWSENFSTLVIAEKALVETFFSNAMN